MSHYQTGANLTRDLLTRFWVEWTGAVTTHGLPFQILEPEQFSLYLSLWSSWASGGPNLGVLTGSERKPRNFAYSVQLPCKKMSRSRSTVGVTGCCRFGKCAIEARCSLLSFPLTLQQLQINVVLCCLVIEVCSCRGSCSLSWKMLEVIFRPIPHFSLSWDCYVILRPFNQNLF